MRKLCEPKRWRVPDDRVIWNFSSRTLQLEYELVLRDSDLLQIINSEMWTFEIWIIKKIRGWDNLFKVWVLKLNTEMRGIKLYFYWQGHWGERNCQRPLITRRRGFKQTEEAAISLLVQKRSLRCVFRSVREIKETLRCCNIQFPIAYFHVLILHENSKCKSQIWASCLHSVVTEMRMWLVPQSSSWI